MDVEVFTGIVNRASTALKKRALGGVEGESAVLAVQKGVSEALNLGDAAVSRIENELKVFKSNSFNEIADLTSKRDKFQKQAEEALTRENDIANRLGIAKSLKYKERTLPNGNTEIRKVNKNGAVMVRELTPEGKNVRVEVTTLEGDYRKTTYNAATGKPIKTYTTVNGDQLITYNDGKSVTAQKVNGKKGKFQKKSLQKTEMIEQDSNFKIYRDTYTDGSYDKVKYSQKMLKPVTKTAYNTKGQIESRVSYDYAGEKVYKLETLFYPETGQVRMKIQEYPEYRTVLKFNEAEEAVEFEYLMKDGTKYIRKAQVDQRGVVNNKECNISIIYPKGSKIRNSQLVMREDYIPSHEILNMSDGTTAVLEKIDGNYNIGKISVKEKNGNTTLITMPSDINAWLENKGKINKTSKYPFAKTEEYYKSQI